MTGKGLRILVSLLILLEIVSLAFALTNEEKLNLLEERFLKEEISEKAYLELKKKYEGEKPEATVELKAGEQVLKNPGFEEVVGNLPTAWISDNWASVPMKFSIDSQVAHSGKYSARLDTDLPEGRGAFYQDVPVKGGDIYTLRVWARSKNLAHGKRGAFAAIACDFAPVGVKPRYYISLQKSLAGDKDWTEVVMRDIVVPEGATKASITLIHSRGTLWFDDVELIKGRLVSKEPCRYRPLSQKSPPDPGENSFMYYSSDYHQHEIYASPDVPTMIAFGQNSRLPKDKPEPPIRLILDLPEGFQVHGGRFAGKSYTGQEVERPSAIQINGEKYQRFRINCVYRKKQSRAGATEIIVSTTIQAPADFNAYYATEIDGKLCHRREIPLHIISIPKIDLPQKIFTWFWPLWGVLDDYPDVTAFNRIGFSIPNPEYFQKVIKSGVFKVTDGSGGFSFLAGEEEAQNIDINGEKIKSGWNIACPTYRGRYYDEIIAQGKRTLDIGLYLHVFNPERYNGDRICFCPRCISQFREYLKTHSTLSYNDPREFMKTPAKYSQYHRLWVKFKVEKESDRYQDYREAMITHIKKKGLEPDKFKMLLFAMTPWLGQSVDTDYSYLSKIERTLEDPLILGGIFDYFAPMMYIDMQPDYRMKADILGISDILANLYQYSKGKIKVYATLSDGFTYSPTEGGQIEPNGMIKPQVLEAFAGGAKGVFLYCNTGAFDALDMKYFAEAMKQVLPVEGIIVEGKPIPKERIRDLNKQTFVKGIESKDGAVILVSEYSEFPKEAKVEYKIKEPAEVIDLSTGKSIAKVTLTNPTFAVKLDQDRAKLFYVGRKKLK